MFFADKQREVVATYKEIILTFCIFCIILFVLHPKDLLQQHILSEEANYDLSMVYLKSMLKKDPTNELLMVTLADKSLKAGKKDLSLRFLELLYTSKDKEIRQKAYLISYELSKDDYYYILKDGIKDKIDAQIKKLSMLFSNIMKEEFYDEKDAEKWYQEALFLNDLPNAYTLLKQLLAQDSNNIELLEKSFYLSNKINKSSDALKYLHALQDEDKQRATKWLMAEYNLIMADKNYSQAKIFLTKHSKNSVYWKEELAKFYVYRKSYKKASLLYMEIFHSSKGYSKQKKYFQKALESLQYGNHLSEAVRLASKYEHRFLKDRNIRIFLLKLYLAAGDLEKAGDLSKKILDEKK